MQKPEVTEINIQSPIRAFGKTFTGDYAQAPVWISELQSKLKEKNIPFLENRVMGIYFDNPMEKKPEELKSFHGIFLKTNDEVPENFLSEMTLSGRYLCTTVSGDPVKSIYEGYGALFNYIEKNGIVLESNTGYQVSSFENGLITTEIYMKMAN